ncbi:MAG: ribbon-helix-helix domain-containing protein [Steroidobacteraceae bacterium]|nr:ribbon-helix-helix domain-containing protein [Steroidobacteraceae bacterium]
MATRVVTAHLPAELAKKLDGLAGQLDRPRGWLVKEAIEAYIGLAEERRRETLEALGEVSADQVVEHDEVEAWTAGLRTGRRGRKRVS